MTITAIASFDYFDTEAFFSEVQLRQSNYLSYMMTVVEL